MQDNFLIEWFFAFYIENYYIFRINDIYTLKVFWTNKKQKLLKPIKKNIDYKQVVVILWLSIIKKIKKTWEVLCAAPKYKCAHCTRYIYTYIKSLGNTVSKVFTSKSL